MADDDRSGVLSIDPLHFSAGLLVLLLLFVFYLLLPRGFRVHHFRAYPKRYAWSARTRSAKGRISGNRSVASSLGQHPLPPSSTVGSSVTGISHGTHHRHLVGQGLGSGGLTNPNSNYIINNRRSRSGLSGNSSSFDPPTHQLYPQTSGNKNHQSNASIGSNNNNNNGNNNSGVMAFNNPQSQARQQQQQLVDLQQNEEIVISAAMQQLRDPGVLIVAHGSRGKPKTVRLQLTESAITWRTETRKKAPAPPKMGKLHQVPLSHIMYVDVGKQTTALRRVENAGVAENLCFSLLTKEGSLDLEANSPRERDALVSCFSMVLDEVHAQNWRDIYRGPSSDMPSSFDDAEADENLQLIGGGNANPNNAGANINNANK